jgi:hypothetical protein
MIKSPSKNCDAYLTEVPFGATQMRPVHLFNEERTDYYSTE